MLKGELLLRLTNNGLDVFRHYISGDWQLKKPFRNPFYNDTKASFNIYQDSNGVYQMKDFGNDLFRGDCFALVGILCGLNHLDNQHFMQIIRKINSDMGLGMDLNSNTQSTMQQSRSDFALSSSRIQEPTQERKSRPYMTKEQPLREHELDYWAEYGITKKILERYNVVSLVNFASENSSGKPYNFRSTTSEPIFAYKGENFIKIYRPRSSVKFLYGGEVPRQYCFGLEQLPSRGDIVFITSGEKDVLSLASRGFNAICSNSETSKIAKNIIESLYHRFKHIVVLFDMDQTGIEHSHKLVDEYATFELKRMELPLNGDKSEKDVSDYFRKGYTRKDFLNLFTLLLDNIYNSTMTMLSSCEIDYNNPPLRSEDIISLAGVPIGTGGNLLGITGGEGTGKSCYVAALVAGAISDGVSTIDTLGATVAPNRQRKAVLLYDTEQSEVQLYNNIRTLLKRAGKESKPDEFKPFSLTPLSRKERLKAIIQSMDRFYYEFDGIQLVVIDGVADLVRCANDESESISVVEELYRLAGIYNTCIICVLHFVPNGLKLRGHLGSEVQRKAAAIVSIEKDKDPAISVVKAIKVREGSALDIPLMQFSWCKELEMHTYRGEKSEKDRIRRKQHDIRKICNEIFEECDTYTHKNLCAAIVANSGASPRTACTYVNDMQEEKLIYQEPNTKLYYKHNDKQR